MREFIKFWWHALRDAFAWWWGVIGTISLIAWVVLPAQNTLDTIPGIARYATWWDWAKFDGIWWLPASIFIVTVICYLFWAPYRYNMEIQRKHAEHDSELLNQLSEDRKQKLAQRDDVARACADYLVGKKNPIILHSLRTAKADELTSNDDLLYIVDKLKERGSSDWLWNEVLEYIPKEKMLFFLQKLREGSVNTQDPWEVAGFLRKVLPEVYYPEEAPLPLPSPTA